MTTASVLEYHTHWYVSLLRAEEISAERRKDIQQTHTKADTLTASETIRHL